MLQNLLHVGAAVLLVLLNGFFVSAEFALVKLRQTQAATLAAGHGWRGRILVDVHGRLDVYLSACQLGITLASLALGWIGEPAFSRLLQPLFARFGVDVDTTRVAALVIAFTLISYLHIVLGELAPKSLAIRRPERISLWTAAPLYAFYWAMYPAIRLLNASANRMLKVFGLGGDMRGEELHYSREELKLIVHAKRANRGGDEYSMMKHALDLPELVVGDVLRTRDQLAVLRDGMSRAEVLAEFHRTRFSRYPWFATDGDHVRGVLHMKDLLHAIAGPAASMQQPATLLRPPILLPLNAPVLDVLKRFRAGDTHLALGVEESGRVVGFFTLEDILEVIVGDIEDEHVKTAGSLVQSSGDDEFTISGGTPIYKLERMLERDIVAPADVNSVGGLIIHRLERLPAEGETLTFDGFDLKVGTMQGARARTIVVRVHPVAAEETQ